MQGESLFIRLKIKIKTDPTATLVKNTEKDPKLSFYLSRDVSVSQSPVGPFPIFTNKSIQVDINCSDAPDIISFRHACIGITMSCDLSLKDDESQVDYGYSRVEPIAESVLFLQDVAEIYSRGQMIPMKLKDKTPLDVADRVERCVISIECTEYKPSKRIKFRDNHDFQQDYVEFQKMHDLYSKYIQFYKEHSAITREVAPMHIPEWRGHHTPIPACMWIKHSLNSDQYALFESFVDRCLDISLQLNGWTRKSFISVSEAQLSERDSKYDNKFNMCIKIACTTASIASNASDYVSDLSVLNDTERFKEVMSYIYAGDCEDLAFFIYLVLASLQNPSIVGSKSPDWLKTLSKIAKLYVPVLITGSATDPSMKRESSNDRDSLICHIFSGMFPRREMCSRLNIHPDKKKLIYAEMNKESRWNKWEDNVPSIVLEGTNMNCPLMNPLFSYAGRDISIAEKQKKMEDYRDAIEAVYPKLSLLSIELQQSNYTSTCMDESSFSPFYHMITNVWMDLSRFGLEIYDFSAGYDTGSRHTYGVGVFKWSDPKIDPSFCFEPVIVMTKEELDICRHVIEKEQPILIPKVSKSLKSSNIPAFLKQLAERHPNKSKKECDHTWVNEYVSYRINRREKLTTLPVIRQTLEDMFSDDERYYSSIEVIEHPIDENGELYVIELRLFPSR